MLIPVYRQSASRWLFKSSPGGGCPGGNWTHDLLIANQTPYRYTATPHMFNNIKSDKKAVHYEYTWHVCWYRYVAAAAVGRWRHKHLLTVVAPVDRCQWELAAKYNRVVHEVWRGNKAAYTRLGRVSTGHQPLSQLVLVRTSLIRFYSIVTLVPPISTMDVWRGITYW